jgi:hypothetical protein
MNCDKTLVIIRNNYIAEDGTKIEQLPNNIKKELDWFLSIAY